MACHADHYDDIFAMARGQRETHYLRPQIGYFALTLNLRRFIFVMMKPMPRQRYCRRCRHAADKAHLCLSFYFFHVRARTAMLMLMS